MKKLTILRGLSGSGKSYEATKLLNEGAIAASTDNFWLDETGRYNFNPQLLEAAHQSCQETVERFMERSESHIVVDNTNTQWWKMTPYFVMAKEHKYEVSLKIIGGVTTKHSPGYAARNKHKVPEEVIVKQSERFHRWNEPTSGFMVELARSLLESALQDNNEYKVLAAKCILEVVCEQLINGLSVKKAEE